jgi:tetratricopeptide (TPR) repeat protein
MLIRNQGDNKLGTTFLEEALQVHREAGDRYGMAYTLYNLGNSAHIGGNYTLALSLYSESLRIAQEFGNRWDIFWNLYMMGEVAIGQENFSLAVNLLKEALALAQEVDARGLMGYVLAGFGAEAIHRGDFESARQFAWESLRLKKEVGHLPGVTIQLRYLGWIAAYEGAYSEALELFKESLELAKRLGTAGGHAATFVGLAVLGVRVADESSPPAHQRAALPGKPPLLAPSTFEPEVDHEQIMRAARLCGWVEALHERSGLALGYPFEQAEYDELVSALKAYPLAEAVKEAWQEGQAMSMEEAVAWALETPEAD